MWAAPGEPSGGFARAIAEVEAFYAARRRPAQFQIAPIADARLDVLLAARGYERFDEVSVEVASAECVALLASGDGVETRCDATLREEWFELSGRRGRFRGEDAEVYCAFLERIAARAGFASARCAGAAEPAAVGLTIVAPPLAGVFSMLTLPEQRRRGLGEAILGALARFARSRGAKRMYLQVEVDNTAARALYARAGFAPVYRYHYRGRARP